MKVSICLLACFVSGFVAATSLVDTMGFEIEWITQGSGPTASKGQKVNVHCTGYGKNGDLSASFWSTRQSEGGDGKPFSFEIGLGRVIKAWDEGVAQIPVGGRAMIKATADYAYGAGGFPAWGIAPNSPLNFDIEVLSIQ